MWPVVVRVPAVSSTPNFGSTQIPVIVQIQVEWCRHASTLFPTTLLVALVVWVETLVTLTTFVLAFGFPISKPNVWLPLHQHNDHLQYHNEILGELPISQIDVLPFSKFRPHLYDRECHSKD